jgi:hypothetical protein
VAPSWSSLDTIFGANDGTRFSKTTCTLIAIQGLCNFESFFGARFSFLQALASTHPSTPHRERRRDLYQDYLADNEGLPPFDEPPSDLDDDNGGGANVAKNQNTNAESLGSDASTTEKGNQFADSTPME